MMNFNPYQFNAQQQRLMQMEQQYPNLVPNQMIQSQQQTYGLNGRLIDDIATVTANEVSMDGSISVFPKRDMSEIYVRSWSADGKINTLKFIPFIEEVVSSSDNAEKSKIDPLQNVTDTLMKRLDEIENGIAQLGVTLSKKPTTSRTKKESDDK